MNGEREGGDRADLADSSDEISHLDPAKRFVLAQSWWIAAELVRRHPELVVQEMHPGDGMYDVLAAFVPPYDATMAVMLNREGTLQVHLPIGADGAGFKAVGTWADALSAADPHVVVKRVESAAGLSMASKAPPSTARSLAYRFIAALLTMAANDRFVWDVRQPLGEAGGMGHQIRAMCCQHSLECERILRLHAGLVFGRNRSQISGQSCVARRR